ncbi:nuclease-related domain-containing protein [Knoellia aerolata]|uniref:NERD domain-containing protein n=1 Tax=Knoellia aerolata DSM 18566 TaxID=1385519 RepID=A0A0A0JYM3_9MICO|nr:nuclease-related domain-containing protein [Knoellia aerolata]KGN40646.1 hypothetical protein N801_10350 [Knoellia aerolata DSM 18566]
MTDQDLVTTRWRRWGKDRLYVETPDGAKVGFCDLAADTIHPALPEHAPALLAAVARWRAQPPHEPASTVGPPQREPTPGPEPAPAPTPEPTPEPGADPVVEPASLVTDDLARPGPARPWVDLATNRAGAEAREQANAARDAAPVRTVLARVLGVHTDERAWRIGADGEVKVAAQLGKVERKDPRWRFLHAVPVGGRGSDIDHVIIGPGGVFTANAKHHPGAKIWVGGSTFIVNGSKQPYVRNARHEAQRAARLLTDACGFPIHVQGLIVTVNAQHVVVKSQPEGVSVLPRMQLTTWLLRHGDILTGEQVDAIYEVARRSTTWR